MTDNDRALMTRWRCFVLVQPPASLSPRSQLTGKVKSSDGKLLLPRVKFRTFAPAIEGTAYCAENRSSMKTGAGLK